MAIFDVNCCLQLLAPAIPIGSIDAFFPLSMALLLYKSVAVIIGVAPVANAVDDVEDVVNESMLDNFT